jgi:hypothetical protein
VTTETMPAPPAEEKLLEELEAEFLSVPTDFWPAISETGLPSVEMPASGGGWDTDDGPQMWMTQFHTKKGCCG